MTALYLSADFGIKTGDQDPNMRKSLPRDALLCKVRYCDCMSSVRPSVCPSV